MLKDFVKWNTRVSAVYALGIWTMVGSYAYFKYTGRYDDPTGKRDTGPLSITFTRGEK